MQHMPGAYNPYPQRQTTVKKLLQPVDRVHTVLERLIQHEGDAERPTEEPKTEAQETPAIKPEDDFLAQTKSKLQDLHQTYVSGLQQISEITDLRKAPDAFLPGNFPK